MSDQVRFKRRKDLKNNGREHPCRLLKDMSLSISEEEMKSDIGVWLKEQAEMFREGCESMNKTGSGTKKILNCQCLDIFSHVDYGEEAATLVANGIYHFALMPYNDKKLRVIE